MPAEQLKYILMLPTVNFIFRPQVIYDNYAEKLLKCPFIFRVQYPNSSIVLEWNIVRVNV